MKCYKAQANREEGNPCRKAKRAKRAYKCDTGLVGAKSQPARREAPSLLARRGPILAARSWLVHRTISLQFAPLPSLVQVCDAWQHCENPGREPWESCVTNADCKSTAAHPMNCQVCVLALLCMWCVRWTCICLQAGWSCMAALVSMGQRPTVYPK